MVETASVPGGRGFPASNRGARQLRKGRCSQRGAYYFVTTRCRKNRPELSAPGNARAIFEALDWLGAHGLLDEIFSLAMPDHLHLVFALTGDRTLSQLVKSLKQFTARAINRRNGTTGAFWQDQYYDHAVRSDESLRGIVLYCWYNPVRAGLVSEPAGYPHWRCRYQLEESRFGNRSHKGHWCGSRFPAPTAASLRRQV